LQFGGSSIVAAAGGNRHSVVASAEGDVFTWGSASYGRLGHNRVHGDWLAPALLGRGQFGGDGRLVPTRLGPAIEWVFGRGEHGPLGLNDEDDRLVRRVGPQRFAGAKVATVATGAADLLSFWGKPHAPGCGCIECTVDIDRASSQKKKRPGGDHSAAVTAPSSPLHLGHR
jgi:hypothetical protein